MKKTKIFYWIFTSLFAFMMFGSAVPDIFLAQMAVDGFKTMGYPVYLMPFLGVAKTLGVLAILIPGYPRIKEWAYAGLFFDLIGATYSIIALGAPFANWIVMALPMLLGVGSYVFYHKKLRTSAATKRNASNFYQDKTTQVATAA